MPNGVKTGGRKKGTPNKRTAALAARAEAAAQDGISPLEYLLSVMRDPAAEEKDRLEAAKAAAPYVHPKLSSIEHKGEGGGPLNVKVSVEFV